MTRFGGKYELGQVVEFVVTERWEGVGYAVGGESLDCHKMHASLRLAKGSTDNLVVGDKVRATFQHPAGCRFGHMVVIGKIQPAA